jgi:hypothetical protein
MKIKFSPAGYIDLISVSTNRHTLDFYFHTVDCWEWTWKFSTTSLRRKWVIEMPTMVIALRKPKLNIHA